METITMSRKEAPRPGLVRAALAGQISNRQGAQGPGRDRTPRSAAQAAAVARGNTVRLGACWGQLPRGPQGRSYAGRRVEVRELLDGRLVVVAHGTRFII